MEVLEMGSGKDSDQGSSGGVEDQSGCNYWTNERHLNFLSSMEEAFVRNMMESHAQRMLINAAANGGAAHDHHHHRRGHHHPVHRSESPRLDRYVPDISESTLDLKTAKIKNSSRSVKISNQVSRSGRRHRERPATSHPYKISLDQVVPHAEDKAGDKDEKERERPQLEGMII